MELLLILLTIGVVGAEHNSNPNDPGFNVMDATDCSADIAFVLDASGSVGSINWQIMLNFIKAIASRLHLSDTENQFGVISFGNAATLHLNLNDSKTHRAFNDSVDAIRYKDENTNTADGLRLLRTQMFLPSKGDRSDFPNIALVFTDGKPTYEKNQTIPEADAIKGQGTYIFTIGIGKDGIDVEELNLIATKPVSMFVFRVLSFDALNSILQSIVEGVCKIKIGTTPPPSACQNKDIAFVLDSSGSIGNVNWDKTKQFVKDFITRLPVGGLNQVGMVAFSTESFLQNYLDEKQTVSELHQIVDNIPWIEQRTNSSGALRLTRNVIFRPNRGDRPNVPNIVIAITDGKSNTDAQLTPIEGKLLRERNIRTFTIGVGLDADMDELYSMSAKPHRYHTFLMKDFDDLVTEGEMSIYDAICTRETEYPSAVPARNDATDKADVDIIFVMDSSSNMGNQAFVSLKQTMINTLKPFINTKSRIAFLSFGSRSSFSRFTQYLTPPELTNAINSLPYRSGSPQWTGMISNLMTLVSQRRPDKQVPIIFISASVPQDASVADSFKEIKKQSDSPVIVITAGSSTIDETMIGKMIASDPSYVLSGDDLTRALEYAMSWACVIGAEKAFSCSFERNGNDIDDCGLQQSTRDQFDWTIGTGSTPSKHTGPSGAYSLPNYLYVEATSKQVGDVAEIYLPMDKFSGEAYCLTFRYHMLGWHIGSLQVIKSDQSGRERRLWMKYGPQVDDMVDSYFDGWKEGSITTALYFEDKIGFRAVRAEGFSGDIALDNIVLRNGFCPFDFLRD